LDADAGKLFVDGGAVVLEFHFVGVLLYDGSLFGMVGLSGVGW
jgi:hypothetical protein